MGSEINNMIRSNNRKKYQFFLKCVNSKEEFNYLSSEEIDKLISCFQPIKDIPMGKILLKSSDEQMQRNVKHLKTQSSGNIDGGGTMYLVMEG